MDPAILLPQPMKDTARVTEGCCYAQPSGAALTGISLCVVPGVVQRLGVWTGLPFLRSRGIKKLTVGYVKQSIAMKEPLSGAEEE